MTRVDWFVLAFVALMALLGLRKGLIASALSAAGVIGGAILGARLAPHLFSGGSRSPYTPVAALAGALVLAIGLEAVGSLAGATLRSGLRLPPLRALDSVGGFALGAAAGLAIVWVLGAAALLLPGQTTLRREAQRSLVVRRLDAIAPPRRLLEALARVDPFPSIARPIAVDAKNDLAVLRVPDLRARPLPLVDPEPGAAVAILGYPGDGPFDAKPGRIGRTVTVLSQDAYGHGPVSRTITSIRGVVRHGDSGGPAVDAAGRVQATIFAARVGPSGGHRVPP